MLDKKKEVNWKGTVDSHVNMEKRRDKASL